MPKLIDIVLVLILLLILGAAIAYIVRAKKNGAKCIGCPANGSCGHAGKSGCGCHDTEQEAQKECCCHGTEQEAQKACCCHGTEQEKE